MDLVGARGAVASLRAAPALGARAAPRQAFAIGEARDVPGDVTTALGELLPTAFRRFLQESVGLTDVLLSPTGRLWHTPLIAAPVDDRGRRLLDVSRTSLTPSLHLALALAQRPDATLERVHQVNAYCNPDLDGARIEEATLRKVWAGLTPLDGVSGLGLTANAQLSVLATHADSAPGLAQALRDHHGQRLTAGECMLRTFPPLVVLGTCHGYGRANGTLAGDPVGLLTVITARGATWAVGGDQQLEDGPVGWILSRTYPRLAAGQQVHDALRGAQLEYLDALCREKLPDDLQQVVEAAGGRDTAALPWCWALTVAGSPPGSRAV